MSDQPTSSPSSVGAFFEGDHTRFRVWAPTARRIELVGENRRLDLTRADDGFFSATLEDWPEGSLYQYRIDGSGPFPDPASRFQPHGVHGLSQVVDPFRFHWSDACWRGVAPEDLVIYELHVGTFTPEGTYQAVADHLPYLKKLGVTAIELMPLADFPGTRNWGYDGVSLYAPARCYGTPDDLRRLVDQAHDAGLAVLLDVVYNHFGPDGNYTGLYSPYYVSPTRNSLWGPAINFDGEHSAPVRRFMIENALYWMRDFHIDGLRLDATHAIQDSTEPTLLAELAAEVQQAFPDRVTHLHAEDHRNLDTMIRPPQQGGWGLDGLWSDDYHHDLRRYLTGISGGVFQDFPGTLESVAFILERGWLFQGEYSSFRKKPRGTDPAGLLPRQLVFFLQNHDRIANHGRSERLHELIGLPVTRAATALTLLLPYTPLLFMGQEWAASTPFLFFTDHEETLGRLIREGRTREYLAYLPRDSQGHTTGIPDPQSWSTFEHSRLRWHEKDEPPHDGMYRLHERLLELRQSEPTLAHQNRSHSVKARAIGEHTLVFRCEGPDGHALAVAARLKGQGAVELSPELFEKPGDWKPLLTTEEANFTVDPLPPALSTKKACLTVDFARPSAIVLVKRPHPTS